MDKGIHIFNSLSCHLLFKLVTSTGTYGWLFWTVFQSIPSRIPRESPGSSVKRCHAKLVGGRVVGWSWVNFQGRSVLLIWIIVWQGPVALAVGAGGGCLDILTLRYLLSSLSPSL